MAEVVIFSYAYCPTTGCWQCDTRKIAGDITEADLNQGSFDGESFEAESLLSHAAAKEKVHALIGKWADLLDDAWYDMIGGN